MLVMTMFYIKLAWDWLENGGGAGGASYLFLTNSDVKSHSDLENYSLILLSVSISFSPCISAAKIFL